MTALPSADPTWPTRLYLVRHGESAGNVARDRAEAAGLPTIDIEGRDVDVPLSALGERQSRALGRWFRARDEAERPTVVLLEQLNECSPIRKESRARWRRDSTPSSR